MIELTTPEQIKIWDQRMSGEDFIGTDPEPELVSRLEDFPAKRRSALDIGCGRGRHLVWLAKEGWRVTGLDWAGPAITKSKAALTENRQLGDVVRGDMRRMPFDESQFHLIVAMRVLHHNKLKDFKRTLHEMKRVVAIGGRVVFCVPGERNAPQSPIGLWVEPNTIVLSSGIEAGIPHHFFTEMELKQLTANWRGARIDNVIEPFPPGKQPLHEKHLNQWFWVTLTG